MVDLRYQWQAETAMDSLSARERASLKRALNRLRTEDYRSLPEVRRVVKPEVAPELYSLLVDDKYRVFFSPDGAGRLLIRDIISRELIEQFQ